MGSIEAVSLKELQETAEQWRAIVRRGKNPIEERDRLRREAAKGDNMLESVAMEAFEARKAMNRLAIVMRHAAAMGLEVDIQATDKAKALLGKSLQVTSHIPSLH